MPDIPAIRGESVTSRFRDGKPVPYKIASVYRVGNAVPSVPSENLTSMGKFSAFLPLRGRIAEDSDPYTVIGQLNTT